MSSNLLKGFSISTVKVKTLGGGGADNLDLQGKVEPPTLSIHKLHSSF